MQCDAKALVELDERVARPQTFPQLVAGDDFAVPLEQRDQYLKGLLLQPDRIALATQTTFGDIRVEDSEPVTIPTSSHWQAPERSRGGSAGRSA